MININSKKMLLIVLVMIIVSCIAVSVFAADSNPVIIGAQNNTTDTNNVNTTDTNNVNTTDTNNTTVILPTNKTANTATSYNTNTSALPKTGENDIYIVTALILVCGVSAIYAYKKIRDYNM